MCGIAGLFAKTSGFEADLGRHFATMLLEMADRGPDSAGAAIYHPSRPDGETKITLLAPAAFAWQAFEDALRARFDGVVYVDTKGDHAVVCSTDDSAELIAFIRETHPDIHVLSAGRMIEIYKQTGLPSALTERFGIAAMSGRHALGHTRMATESAVTVAHSHPFSTGNDLCLVHNGSLSNHNRLREDLRRRGVSFSTDNDSEVAAGYLTHRLAAGDSLERALAGAIEDLDGFYTFAVGTQDGFAVLRDPIACKPAVIAETDDWVGMASEYRALARLPGADTARTWEPEPGRIYSWKH